MRGNKHEKKFFPETHVYREQKTMDKNRLERVRKHVFYKHTNIVTINGGKNREKKIFLETHLYRDQKTMEKNFLEKVRKYVFYKHTNIVTKKREKKRENFFSRNTRISRKNDGKKSSRKSAKTRFL